MVIIALLLAAAAPEQGSAAEQTVTVDPQGAGDPERPRVREAGDLIRARHPADAIPILDAVIADEQRLHAGEARQLFCSRSTTETLLYMTMATSVKKNAVALDSTWCDALFLKAFALVDLGRANEAEAPLRRAVELAPMNAQYLGELGEWYKSRKDWTRAKQQFDSAATAAAFSPDEVKSFEQRRAWRGQAFVLTEYGKLHEAEALYRKCLDLDAGDTTAKRELDYIAGLRHQAGKGAS